MRCKRVFLLTGQSGRNTWSVGPLTLGKKKRTKNNQQFQPNCTDSIRNVVPPRETRLWTKEKKEKEKKANSLYYEVKRMYIDGIRNDNPDLSDL